MVRRVDRYKVNPVRQDRQEIAREAVRYLKAQDFLRMLYKHSQYLTRQQMKTLRGQALNGDIDGAMRGLGTIMNRR